MTVYARALIASCSQYLSETRKRSVFNMIMHYVHRYSDDEIFITHPKHVPPPVLTPSLLHWLAAVADALSGTGDIDLLLVAPGTRGEPGGWSST
jgi:hypothetical protein